MSTKTFSPIPMERKRTKQKQEAEVEPLSENDIM